jgi:hypothetical protein
LAVRTGLLAAVAGFALGVAALGLAAVCGVAAGALSAAAPSVLVLRIEAIS